jgi:hypothetical protein
MSTTLMKRIFLARLILTLPLVCTVSGWSAVQVISNRTLYLGVPGQPEWDIFAGRKSDGEKLGLSFEGKRNEREFTLFIRQNDVKEEWTVKLNGTKLGTLFQMEANLLHTLAIPPGVLRDGLNELQISAKTRDDILIEEISIGEDPKARLLSSGAITIRVKDSVARNLIPSRITIVDSKGALASINDFASTNLATRPGVIYTSNGEARVTLLPGEYTVYATRGPEYSVAKGNLTASSTEQALDLGIQRIIDTSGWAAADTHIHTFSLSKHGDALLYERIITLAAEGIELPVSTEHNQNGDYLPAAKALGLERYFTIIPGDEVTTAKGHFNIFPVALRTLPPDYRIEDWPELMKSIRATPNVQVVILNHAKDTHSGFTPFASTNLNLVTGRNLRGNFDFTFDAMEAINSGAMRSDWMEPFRAWFALLNRGYKIVAVGGSDSHDVSRYIVGQGRTYIRVDDRDPGDINISKACANLKAGHAVVSLGIFPQITVKTERDSAGPGDLISAKDAQLEITVTADWPPEMSNDFDAARVPQIKLFANGREAFDFYPRGPHRGPFSFTKKIPKPPNDTYYVAIASALAATDPFWGLARPYQPTSKHWDSFLLAATNPVWVDADGDGKFSSPHQYAERILAKFGDSPRQLWDALAAYDWATAAQAAELLQMRGQKLGSPEMQAAIARTPQEVEAGVRDYVRSVGEQ